MKPKRRASIARTKPRNRKPETDATDQALNCCRHIATLARLLEVCGAEAGLPRVDAALVADASGMIRDEARQLQEVLHAPEI